MALGLASFGGIKAKEKIEYNNNLVHFGKVNNTFTKAIEQDEYWKAQKQHLPKWHDNKSWGEFYENKSNHSDNGSSFKKRFSSADSFKNYCYKNAEEDKKLTQCQASYASWCEECLRDIK